MRPFYWFSRTLLKLYFGLYSHQTYGLMHIPKGSCIIAPNHASYFDPPIIAVSCPDEVYFLARKSLFKHFIFGSLIKNLNAIPLGGNTQDLSVFKLVFRLLDENKKVIIFPEGIRTHTGEFSNFKTGLAMISLKKMRPIVPTYIDGTFRVWPRGQSWPKFSGKTACVFGSPIDPNFFETLDKKNAQAALTQHLHQRICALRQWYIDGAHGNPP